MYIIIEGEFSDWKVKGYVETEREALDVCADHNAKEDNYYDQWYFEEVKPMKYCPMDYCRDTCIPGFGMYEYEVVFNPNKEFLYTDQWSIFPTVHKEPEIVQEDQYCYVVRVTTYSEEKATKIAKDFLMKTLAERAGIV